MATPRPTTAHSAISSAMSEDGDRSRPPSGVYTQPQATAPTSQPARTFPAQHGHQNAQTGASRPQSSASRVSRTHVPSLAAHAFFRPMTSQQAQRQRGTRPSTGRTMPSTVSDDNQSVATDNRYSMSTVMQGQYVHQEEPEMLPPPSRGTEYTDPGFPDRTTTNASPTADTTVRSLGESVRLLKDRDEQKHRPPTLNLGGNLNQQPSQDRAQKSPMGSFRSNFSLGTKRHSVLEPGHQHLSSTASSPRYDMTKPPEKPLPRTDLGRNYEYFEGNTIFFWGGRLQNARDRPVNIATGIFTIIPGILFFVFSAPWLWHNVSPAIPIIFAYLFYICLSSFFHASLVDPGIFPRNLHPFPPADLNEDPLAIGPPQNDWVMVKLATSDTAAMDVPVKYCKTCNIWRPPRCYHCRVCDSCIETLDHHCVWLNNCVGRRNYRYFFTYVSSATILSFFLIGASIGHIVAYQNQKHISFGASVKHWQVPFAMFIYGLLAFPYPGSLWVYHLFLTGKGETTREYLNSHKFAKVDRHLPFTQGNMMRNWLAVLARPRPPTYLHFKRSYEEGDQRFGSRKGRRQAPLVEEAQGGGMEMKPIEGSAPAFEGPSGRPQAHMQAR